MLIPFPYTQLALKQVKEPVLLLFNNINDGSLELAGPLEFGPMVLIFISLRSFCQLSHWSHMALPKGTALAGRDLSEQKFVLYIRI